MKMELKGIGIIYAFSYEAEGVVSKSCWGHSLRHFEKFSTNIEKKIKEFREILGVFF